MPLAQLLIELGASMQSANGTPTLLDKRVTLKVDDVPLGELLTRVLRGESFMLQTVIAPDSGCGGAEHRLWLFSEGVTVTLPGGMPRDTLPGNASAVEDSATGLTAHFDAIDAAQTLATSEPSAAVRELESIAVGGADAAIREDAIYALADLGSADSLASLEKVLADPIAEVRATAVVALADLRDARVIPALAVAATDPAVLVREEALYALAGLDAESVRPLLVQAATDADAGIRELARELIEEMGDR